MSMHCTRKNFSRAALLLLSGLALASAPAHADTTYSFALDATSGGISGTGTITFAEPIPVNYGVYANTTASSTTYSDEVTGLTIDIGGSVFVLSENPGSANLSFNPNTLENFSFATNGSGVVPNISLGGTTYSYTTTLGAGPAAQGKVVFDFTPDVAATPEPSSLILMGTGLLAAAWMARRKLTV